MLGDAISIERSYMIFFKHTLKKKNNKQSKTPSFSASFLFLGVCEGQEALFAFQFALTTQINEYRQEWL